MSRSPRVPDPDADPAQAGRRRKRRTVPPPPSIDVDPAVTAGYIHDRYDLLIRGRAVSSTAVEEVVARLDGAVVGRVLYGGSSPVSQHDQANDDGRVQHGFHINIPLRRGQAHRKCTCVVAARQQDGETYEEAFDLLVDPANPMPVAVISGPTRSSQTYPHVRAPVVLYVERAALDHSGQLLVHGWAISLVAMVTVQVFVDEQHVGAAILGGQRDDVATAFPAYWNARASGFALSKRIEVPTGTEVSVRVQAISLNGFLHEAVVPMERARALAPGPTVEATAQIVPAPSVTVAPASSSMAARPIAPELNRDPRRVIAFHCDDMDLDAAGNLYVGGWAVCPIGISAVTVDLDDQPIGEAELGLPREDVGEQYSSIPMARYAGFRLTRMLGAVPAGEHRLRVLLRNGLDDLREEIRTVLIAQAAPVLLPATMPGEFRLEIDSPTVVAGAAVEPVTGRLTIEGWALSRSGITGIEVLLDDQRLGDAHYGLARQDVGRAFPDWVDSARSGYAFHCPPRSLRNGEHVVQLNVRARSGEILEHRFNVLVGKSEGSEDGMTIRQRMTQVEADVSRDVLDSLAYRPDFRLILRQDTVLDIEGLLATLASLRTQVYRDWRLEVLASDASTGDAVRALLAEAADDLVERIDVIDASDAATADQPIGDVAETSTLRLVGFLSPGDRLGCDALLQFTLAGGLHRDADMLYADELRLSPASREREPFFKPDFSPDLLLSTNYIGRPWVASTALIGRSGVTVRDLMEAGEYDAVLRCTEQAVQVHHVPRLLCERGVRQIDDIEREAAALTRAAARRGIVADVSAGAVPGTWRFRRTAPVTGMVSIIIPTCAAQGYIETCIKSLRERTAYRNFEIVCVDNIPDSQVAWKTWLKENADKVVAMPDAFNWSHFNNRGAKAAAGEYLLFMNDDVEVVRPDWLNAMLEHAQRPEVAVVGPQLLYPDNKVQHAGMFLATHGTARHAFRFSAADEPGYFGLALTQRNVIAVTGACMLMRRGVFQALGGFDEAHQIINNDLDFCLRAHRAGKLTVYTPYASLIHHEAASRDRMEDVFDLGQFAARWNTLFSAGDPYFNPQLSRHSDEYRPDDEPVETIFAGHPLFCRADIKRILAVKVDHIGDFVMALPAIRRLKQIFPAAAIHVLASRAAHAFAETEACIDEFIEFEFFHAVSGLGPREIGEVEYQALRDRLAPYRFDIAVDLRKHLDTRDVLCYTSARFLAGYDYMGQFPFLDVALEWEGDRNLQRKRSHVTGDLINLVEAIGRAGDSDRTRLEVASPAAGPPDFLPAAACALFDKPVVAVHPGVGNVMRQWPAEHFASLIDLLVTKNAVNAVLIGGMEEVELAEEVLSQVTNRDAVISLVGKTPLRRLPELLLACALYVGNNSGPKHIAAALGVPTIGIHSGVVDAIEWGPVGKRAVAMRRNMACSPCYLARPQDCTRNLACMRGLEPSFVQEMSEIFLARPLDRDVAVPLIETEPQVDDLAKARRRRSTNTSQNRAAARVKSRRRRRRQVASVAAD